MSVEERELGETESGPTLLATLLQPFVDAQTLRFNYVDWEVRSSYVFTILACDQEIDGYMKPKAMYFDAMHFYFGQVLRINNYLPLLPYHSNLFKDGVIKLSRRTIRIIWIPYRVRTKPIGTASHQATGHYTTISAACRQNPRAGTEFLGWTPLSGRN